EQRPLVTVGTSDDQTAHLQILPLGLDRNVSLPGFGGRKKKLLPRLHAKRETTTDVMNEVPELCDM
ncbi:MAG: hypothetical protein ACLT1W_15245, partial [Alistipes onderdonkii]